MTKKYVDLKGNEVLTVEVPQELKSMRLLAGTELDGVDKQEVFEYLNELREDGATNMFGAGAFVAAAFGVSKGEAQRLVVEWMETFSERHPE